jgi:hypothetical protein
MVPSHVFGPTGPSVAPKPLPPGFKGHEPKARLGPLFIIIPSALLGLVVLVPLGFLLTHLVRTRRIERRFRREKRP